ncbi:MAG: hypothetical protein PWQ57_2025 [Desulfovibrionales bacterium]|jgi:hypothetical protein|nr:hypothetical protein [Desulfovibrionales bacterium]
MIALAGKWLPGRAADARTLGEALWLEQDYWEKMSVAVCNGVVKAFKG